jgi:hypothetical protein
MKDNLSGLIESLDISDFQKQSLRSRWLDQVLWMEKRACTARDWYYILRLITIVGGVLIPALVSITFTGSGAVIIRWVTFFISLSVALSASIEEFMKFGDRWRNYRRTAELLKVEGWQYFQLSGPYQRRESHANAYPKFATRVEEIIHRDVQIYISEIVSELEAKAKEVEGESDFSIRTKEM